MGETFRGEFANRKDTDIMWNQIYGDNPSEKLFEVNLKDILPKECMVEDDGYRTPNTNPYDHTYQIFHIIDPLGNPRFLLHNFIGEAPYGGNWNSRRFSMKLAESEQEARELIDQEVEKRISYYKNNS